MSTGALLGGASILGGVGSSIASNVTNKNIANNANAFNERMQDKQIAYEKEMYMQQLTDSLKYSDPSFLRERLEAAGYNPATLISGSNFSSPSMPSAGGIASPQATQIPADFSGFGDSLLNAFNLYNEYETKRSQRAVTDAQAANLRIEGKYLASKQLAELAKIYKETESMDVKNAISKMMASFDADFKASSSELNREQSASQRMAQRIMMYDGILKLKEIEAFPQRLKLELAQGAADIALKAANKKFTEAQTKHEVRKMINTVIQGQGMRIQNEFQQQTFGHRLQRLEVEITKMINNAGPDALFGAGNWLYQIHQGFKNMW